MADTYESYEIYVCSSRQEEFRTLLSERFGSAIELNWRDTIEVDEDLSDESYEAYVDSDRDTEFSALLQEHFGTDVESSWLDTLSV